MIVNQVTEEERIRREEERRKNIEESRKCQKEEIKQAIKELGVCAIVGVILLLTYNITFIKEALLYAYILAIIVLGVYLSAILFRILALRIHYAIAGKHWTSGAKSNTVWMDRP